jgi:hypothetical protein
MIILFGSKFAEGYVLVNDEEQAARRVFAAIKNIIEASPLLKKEAKNCPPKNEGLDQSATMQHQKAAACGLSLASPLAQTVK